MLVSYISKSRVDIFILVIFLLISISGYAEKNSRESSVLNLPDNIFLDYQMIAPKNGTSIINEAVKNNELKNKLVDSVLKKARKEFSDKKLSKKEITNLIIREIGKNNKYYNFSGKEDMLAYEVALNLKSEKITKQLKSDLRSINKYLSKLDSIISNDKKDLNKGMATFNFKDIYFLKNILPYLVYNLSHKIYTSSGVESLRLEQAISIMIDSMLEQLERTITDVNEVFAYLLNQEKYKEIIFLGPKGLMLNKIFQRNIKGENKKVSVTQFDTGNSIQKKDFFKNLKISEKKKKLFVATNCDIKSFFSVLDEKNGIFLINSDGENTPAGAVYQYPSCTILTWWGNYYNELFFNNDPDFGGLIAAFFNKDKKAAKKAVSLSDQVQLFVNFCHMYEENLSGIFDQSLDRLFSKINSKNLSENQQVKSKHKYFPDFLKAPVKNLLKGFTIARAASS